MITALAAAEKWKILAPKEHAKLKAVAGFSLGEFSALVFSGALSFEDGVKLVHARAQAMQMCAENHEGGMASVAGMDDSTLSELCMEASVATGKLVKIANYLFPKGRTVSGDVEVTGWVLLTV